MPVVAVRCRFLLGTYQAADPFGAAGAAEWPPHPFRLHAALLSAAAELGGERPTAGGIDALRWLESLGAPAVHHSPASPRTPATSYVPRNPVAAEFQRSSARLRKHGEFVSPWLRNAREFPTSVPEVDEVTFRWDAAEAPPAALAELADGVSWLGSSRSPVTCHLTSDVPDGAFVEPAPDGAVVLRVAEPGTTDALVEGRHEWPPPVSGRPLAYGPPAPPSRPACSPRVLAVRGARSCRPGARPPPRSHRDRRTAARRPRAGRR